MSEPLPFTGERFTPECVREIWYEHWHRYAWVARFARGRRVLDAACGEGYGTALLARHAAHATGVDLSPDAVAHAKSRYAAPNLEYRQGDATALDALPDASYDLIVSFETLEHVEAQERMVAGYARLLAPNGLLVLSSPDKRTYSDLAGHRNEYHVRELYRDELLALLAPHFPQVRLFGQKLLFQSAIWDLDTPPTRAVAQTSNDDASTITEGIAHAPLYFIALCARDATDLPGVAGEIALFGDEGESVYAHYHHEVRRNIAAGTLLIEMERKLAEAESRARVAEAAASAPIVEDAAPRGWLTRLFGR